MTQKLQQRPISKLARKQLREQEVASRRARFRASLLAEPELLRELSVAVQHAAPAAWLKVVGK